MKNKIILALLYSALLGCTSARVSSQLAAGVIGCPSKDIKITNETASVRGTHEFTAECDGRKYICSYVYGSNTNCTERMAKVEQTAQSSAEDCAKRKRYNDLLLCPPKN
jgi:uncharacterized OsmC-like protein